MQSEVARDLSWSAAVFVRAVWPVVRACCGGGDLIPVESVTEGGVAHSLDVLAGIDAWQVHGGMGMRGIASRVQKGQAWNTFTIRYRRASGAETEYVKRLRAMNQEGRGWLYPHLTVQAYVAEDGATLLSAAVVQTTDLFRAAEQAVTAGLPEARDLACRDATIYLNRAYDGNEFIVVPWMALKKMGLRLWRHELVGDEPMMAARLVTLAQGVRTDIAPTDAMSQPMSARVIACRGEGAGGA